MSGKVRDGVLGTIIYAILARNERMFFSPTNAGTTLYVSLALAGARHWFMVMYWLQTKAWFCRMLN